MKLNENFLAQMREAAKMLQSEGPMAATAVIQRALSGNPTPSGNTQSPAANAIPQDQRNINSSAADVVAGVEPLVHPGDLLARFKNLHGGKWASAASVFTRQGVDDIEDVEVREEGAESKDGKGRFVSGSCTNAAGTRSYKLYIPSGYAGEALPLIVMLHGCTQNPDDFAAGTGMNAIADEHNCFVVYPAQAKAANGSNCWNWFQPGDQCRDRGEPSIIADITRRITREYKIDTRRVYAAGLSAGGAMAAILGAAYPDLYAAIGIHSGLPVGVANDAPSAFAAMKCRKGKISARAATARPPAILGHAIPVIVFHGDRDSTVHASNGDTALQQCIQACTAGEMNMKVEQSKSRNGRSYTRAVHHDAQGKVFAEKWIVHGAGHAWAGGCNKGSYTDPQGPDATREMIRFFYTHAHEGHSSS